MPPWSDVVVLLGVLVSSGWWLARLHRQGLRGGGYAAAAAVAFLGLALIVSMAAHCIDVLSRLAVGTGYDGSAFVYDFRTYSLLLLGVVLIVAGAGCSTSPPSSARPLPTCAAARSAPCSWYSPWWRR